MSHHIREANPDRVTNPLRILISGGATSVLNLENRTSTRDVDFLSSGLVDELNEILDAKSKATRDLETYPGDWLSAEMVAYVNNEPDCQGLYRNSIILSDIVYQSDVLIAYVADWRFQLTGKIERCYRLSESDNPEDMRHLSDAIHILHLLVKRNGGPLSVADVRTWYALGPQLTPEEFAYVDAHYQRHFKVQAGFTD